MSGFARVVGQAAGAVATIAAAFGNPVVAAVASPPARDFTAKVRS